MAELALIYDLQPIILFVALIGGGLRGVIGYYMKAPEGEKLDGRKIIQTLVRYMILNFIAVDGLIAIGVLQPTVMATVIVTIVFIANDLGIDAYKQITAPKPATP